MAIADLLPTGGKNLGEIIGWVIFSISVSVGVTLWLLASHAEYGHRGTVAEDRFIDARMNIIKANDQLMNELHELQKELYDLRGIKLVHDEMKADIKEMKADIRTLQRSPMLNPRNQWDAE